MIQEIREFGKNMYVASSACYAVCDVCGVSTHSVPTVIKAIADDLGVNEGFTWVANDELLCPMCSDHRECQAQEVAAEEERSMHS